MHKGLSVGLVLAAAFLLGGCADFWAYNLAKRPRVVLVPELKLTERVLEKRTGKGEARGEAYSAWAEEYKKRVDPIYQWPTSICDLFEPLQREPIKSMVPALWPKPEDLKVVKEAIRESYKRALPDVSAAALAKDTVACQPEKALSIASMVDTRLLDTIDRSHDKLLVGRKELVRNEDFEEFQKSQKNRTSIMRPTSLSLSVVPTQPAAKPEAPGIFLTAQGQGQKALVEFAGKQKETPKDLEDLLKQLKPKEGAKQDFEALQNVDVTMSSVLNTPDQLPRFDYLTTYVYIHPHPYPPNGRVDLGEEFWLRLIGIHAPRAPVDKWRTLDSDLDLVWYTMAVRVEAVTTTVVFTTVDIANVTRASTQSLAGTASANLTTPTTPAGATVGASVQAQSQLTTTVQEALRKQLDQRSTYLSDRRDLLRITQRGLDSVNVGGSVIEKLTLKVPPALTSIPMMAIKKECGGAVCTEGEKAILRISPATELSQPLYSRVEATAVTLAVVRLPYKLKRSATEKFGLPDSADAFEVVHVGLPQHLVLWQWARGLNWLSLEDLRDTGPPSAQLLRVRMPRRGQREFQMAIPITDETFVPMLKRMIADPDVMKACRKSNGFMLVSEGNQSVGTVFIGKDRDGVMVPFEAGDLSADVGKRATTDCPQW